MTTLHQVNETDVLLKVVEGGVESLHKQQHQESWEKVYQARQNRSIMKAELRGTETHADKLCGVVLIGHIKGIIPLELSGYEKDHQLKDAVGQDIYFKVLQLDRSEETFVGSRKDAIDHLQGITMDMVKVGMVVEALIVRVNNRSLVLDIGAVETDLRVEDVAYEWIDSLHDRFSTGDAIRVKVTAIDEDKKKLAVSSKELLSNPWPDCTKRFQKNCEYTGRVSGVVEYGVFVNLEPGVDVLCRQPAPTVGRVKKGQKVKVRIKNVHTEEQKIDGIIKKKI